MIMVEDTKLVSTHPSIDGAPEEESEVETLAQVSKGENVRQPGSDVREGDVVMRKGDGVSGVGGEVGTLAFVGKQAVCPFLSIFLTLLLMMRTGESVQETCGGSLEHWQ